MENGRAEVDSGIQEATRASKSLKVILHSAKEVETMIQLIAAAATEQTSASGEISVSANQIAQLANENSQSAEETADACKSLSSLANDLDGLIRQFQLGDEGHRGNDSSRASA